MRVKFTPAEYCHDKKTIYVAMPHDLYIEKSRYRNEHGELPPILEVESPTGNVVEFHTPRRFYSGYRYRNNNLTIELRP